RPSSKPHPTKHKRPAVDPHDIACGGLRYPAQKEIAPEKIKPERAKRTRAKNDPILVAKTRELRDRWLEQVNADPGAPGLLAQGKYDVSRALSDMKSTTTS